MGSGLGESKLEYIRFSRRLVTPVSVPNLNLALQTKQLLIPFQIYPADANLIVSLFDFHVSPPRSSGPPAPEERLEILEAGTGHGALTLHLSRAIHAANAAKPDVAPVESETPDAAAAEGGDEGYASGSETAEDEWSMWRSSRTAVIHTIDVSAKFSQHAAKIVRGFRHGIYADNVDFHVGNVSGWVQAELARRAETNSRQGNPSPSPFLTHAFLDLPATANHLATVASAMYTDGTLIVFNPSITQVAECLQRIRQDGLPLYLEQVVELGTNATSGGREWDVRAVRPRAALREEELAKIRESGMGGEEVTRDGEQVSAESGNRQAEWSLVCRPKVGERIVGGGFLGVFKKTRNTTDPVAQDTAA
ncbi:hypothetical protein H2203_001238 [Taxawa tesnikishii (nom. ined.)]|nr:hypothetical protein H2203_001238 [Dothideales sp. JES 119]